MCERNILNFSFSTFHPRFTLQLPRSDWASHGRRRKRDMSEKSKSTGSEFDSFDTAERRTFFIIESVDLFRRRLTASPRVVKSYVVLSMYEKPSRPNVARELEEFYEFSRLLFISWRRRQIYFPLARQSASSTTGEVGKQESSLWGVKLKLIFFRSCLKSHTQRGTAEVNNLEKSWT